MRKGPVIGVAAAALWAAAPASARWRIERTPSPASADSHLDGVSCASTRACVAVGYANRGPGKNKPLAERWNGKKWALARPPLPRGALTGYLDAVSCASARVCVAVGGYENRTRVFVALTERWNGKGWSLQDAPNPRGKDIELDGVSCPSASVCTAAGTYERAGIWLPLAERLSSRRWSLQRTPAPAHSPDAELSGGVSCSSASACTAVGVYANAQQTHGYTLAERWNGRGWSIQRSPNVGPAYSSVLRGGVSCTSRGACMAAGFSLRRGSIGSPLGERWNASKWTLARPPKPPGAGDARLAAISCSKANACFSVGTYTHGLSSDPLAELFNGQRWSLLRPPVPRHNLGGDLNGVSCPSSRTCVLVGDRVDYAGDAFTLAERWGG